MLLVLVVVSLVAALLAPPVLVAFALRAIAAPLAADEQPCRPSRGPLVTAPQGHGA
jgi:hypothetical protein